MGLGSDHNFLGSFATIPVGSRGDQDLFKQAKVVIVIHICHE
jgi:hypothetical protein